MKRKTNPPHDIILVRWVDSHYTEGWIRETELEELNVMPIVSVGFLIDEDDKALRITQSIGDNQYCSIMTIPQSAVIERKVLGRDAG